MIQPQINSLVVGQKYDYALRILENNKESYGPKNQLLYYMDYGLVLHQAREYEESIKALEQAKVEFDKQITTSISNQATTWLVNDNAAPYRGEDYERVMINIIQALNFAALGNFEGALVEARDVDVKLSVINKQYKADEKNKYKEDAFARFLMGVLYEAEGTAEGYNNAFISYRKAIEIYERDFYPNYGIAPPEILKANIKTVAEFMGQDSAKEYQERYPNVEYIRIKDKKENAEVYLVYYHGFSPIKRQSSVPLPLPGGIIGRLSFPRYDKRLPHEHDEIFKAVGPVNQEVEDIQTVHDITQIAMQNLQSRKKRVIAKAVLRSGGKYAIETELTNQIRQGAGNETASVFRYIASLYNITSEQADLRSWQTLPGDIRLAKLNLKPGRYQLYFNTRPIEDVHLKPGETKFIIYRPSR